MELFAYWTIYSIRIELIYHGMWWKKRNADQGAQDQPGRQTGIHGTPDRTWRTGLNIAVFFPDPETDAKNLDKRCEADPVL